MARILQVFRPRTGGTFGHVRVLSAELAERGHEVAVVRTRRRRPANDFGRAASPAAIPRSPEPRCDRPGRPRGRSRLPRLPSRPDSRPRRAGGRRRAARAGGPRRDSARPHPAPLRIRGRVGAVALPCALPRSRAVADAARDPRALRLRGRAPDRRAARGRRSGPGRPQRHRPARRRRRSIRGSPSSRRAARWSSPSPSSSAARECRSSSRRCRRSSRRFPTRG